MAKEKKSKKSKKEKKKDDSKNKSFIVQLKTAYRDLDDKKKFYRTVLIPLVVIGILVFLMPIILKIVVPVDLAFNPATFAVGGIVPILMGILYPFVTWKNKENDINGKMHFFITHLRVLAISDLSLKDIVNMLGGKTVYGSLGEELNKISVISIQWRMPLSKTFRFISAKTPSKILKDFLDRFSQSLDSGVEHREFIEIEQEAVLQEYKTMYETSNENIIILNEIYVSMLISIIFVMSLGIVLPVIMGPENMGMYIYLSSFLMIITEVMLLYLMKAMIPPDEIWHRTGEKGEMEAGLDKLFKISLVLSIIIGSVLFFAKYSLAIAFTETLPFEIIVSITITPLIIVGIKTFIEEQDISRKEVNFLGFLPALGSISAMRGGKINESVYYLSEKDYGVLTRHVRNLYRRLRTRINDDDAWEWFGVDTGSNFIQRSGEMFREATFAAANPRTASRMIAENIRKIRDLRVKKLTIVNTSIALFGGITFGIAFSIYISLIIGQHLNEIMLETGNPFEATGEIQMGSILQVVPPSAYETAFIIIFLVLAIHCYIMALTLKTVRGSHKYVTYLFFVPFVWVVTITYVAVTNIIGGMI